MTYPVIQTPDERFKDLKDYPFEPNYIDCLGYRIHYVDEGEGPLILLLHGEPSWSYLYRKMIPLLVNQGYRAVAPDLLGFGKSDKLTKRSNYSYQLLVDIKSEFINNLNQEVDVMFMQDWGSLIGFRLMETVGNKINRILLSNGTFPFASGFTGLFGNFLFKLNVRMKGKVTQDELMKDLKFVNWVAFSQTTDEFPVGFILQNATHIELSKEEVYAYNAPFPDETYKEGVRQLPMLVASQLRKNYKVWQNVIKQWKKPFLTIFGDGDPITRGNEKKFIAKVPGANGLKHKILTDARHFIQDDQPEKLVDGILELMKTK